MTSDENPSPRPAEADPALSLEVEYLVAADNTIVEVGAHWNLMAQAHGAPQLDQRAVVGRDLYRFVQGDVTRMYVGAMLDAARTLGQSLTRPYRCDLPGFRRFMEMDLIPQGERAVLLRHRVIRIEAMPQRFRFTVADPKKAGLRPLVRCSLCNRVKAGGQWLEPECALTEPATDQGSHAEQGIFTAYGVCPECLSGIGRLSAR